VRTSLSIALLALLMGALLWWFSAGDEPTPPPAPIPPERPADTGAALAVPPSTAPRVEVPPAPEQADRVPAADPLDLPVRSGFSYRDMLTGVGARIERVTERLADPMCRTDEHLYRPALRERCAAEDLVLLGELAMRCHYLARTPLDELEALESAVQDGQPWTGSHGEWVEAQGFYDRHQTARRATDQACDEWGERLEALDPLTPALPDDADADTVQRLLLPSFLVRAAEQGMPLDVGSYSQMAMVDMQLRRRLEQGDQGKQPGRFSREDYDGWLAEERAVATVIDGMIREDPASGVAERVYFEMSRLPEGLAPEQMDFQRLDDGQVSEAEAQRYREALKYYFAAERLRGESLRDSLYDYAGVARAENALHVNDVELARHLGYQLAAELEDSE